MATTGLSTSSATKYDSVTPPVASSLPASLINHLLVDLSSEVAQARSFSESSSSAGDGQGKKIDLEGLMAYQATANYIAVAMIFLRSNGLLTRDLVKEDVKRRLLGHWGTCAGLNFVYAHANYLISSHDGDEGGCPKVLYVTGPGHGAPAILASLFMEGSITRFYPQYPQSRQGLESFIRVFSFPGKREGDGSAFPSHVNAETPGAIHEGGELGYALAVAYGSVMDSPDLISVVVVGDGESETGPAAAAWHSHKYLDPKESGAVLPVLHVNGYKIGERTIPGTMDDLELACLYTGYGYKVRFVEYGVASKTSVTDHEHDVAVNYSMAVSMEWAYKEIRAIQQAARTGKPIDKPRWPMIILRTPKGWTGPAKLGDNPLVGSWRSHQVPLPLAATDQDEFDLLKTWLESYKPHELFNAEQDNKSSQAHDASHMAEGLIEAKALRIVPRNIERRMGMLPDAYKNYAPLSLSDWKKFGVESNKSLSAMKATGAYLAEVVKMNPSTFRIFSPDEITSNKLSDVLEVTHRNFQWDPETAHDGGRVIEMLSEHTLQGWVQGYTLTGRSALFPSYESFLGIVTTMIEQYAKLIKMSKETTWRKDVASLNYIETSTLWRQEHNGYSHQNPGLVGSLLGLPHNIARIYFPAEANSAISIMDHCLRSKNYVNLIVGSKNPAQTWLSAEEAEKHCIAGASVWTRYSTDSGLRPDVVLVGIGVEVTHEVVAASALLRAEGIRVRVVNIVDLLILGAPGLHPHALTEEAFESLFTADRPVIINFHGYPKEVAGLLYGRTGRVSRHRVTIHGYIEEGTTTTPWSMLRLNKASRFDLADEAIQMIGKQQPEHEINPRIVGLSAGWKHVLAKHAQYTHETGEDPSWVDEVPEPNKD